MVDFTLAILCAIFYFAIKFVEAKVLKKETPLKDTFRNSLLVGSSVIVGTFAMDQINYLANANSAPHVFVTDPDF